MIPRGTAIGPLAARGEGRRDTSRTSSSRRPVLSHLALVAVAVFVGLAMNAASSKDDLGWVLFMGLAAVCAVPAWGAFK
jgi:hypothetical protein